MPLSSCEVSRPCLPSSPASGMTSSLFKLCLPYLGSSKTLVFIFQLSPFFGHSLSQGGLQLCCFSLLPRCGKRSLAWMLCCVFHSMAVKQNIAALFHSQARLDFFYLFIFIFPTHNKQPVDTSLCFLSGVETHVLFISCTAPLTDE